MSKMNAKRQILYAGIAFAAIALFFGMWSQYNLRAHPKPLVLQNGTVFPTPRIIQPFDLQHAPDGKSFSNEQLKGHWTMMFFGFTHCAMLCPTTLTTLNHFYNNLQAAHFEQLPQVVFVSIDPERDDLNRIGTYVTSFNKNFTGATATEEKLDRMTNELNILFTKANPNKDEDYQIDHSGTVLLFNPQGHLAGLFSPPIEAQALTDDYQAIVKNANRMQ